MCSSIAKDKGLQLKSLDDPILKKLRIGVHLLGEDYNNPPPVSRAVEERHRRQRGRLRNLLLCPESAEQDYRCGRRRADRCRHRLGSRRGILRQAPAASRWRWSRSRPARRDLPFAFDISMGVKPGDDALLAQIGKGAGGEARRNHEYPEGITACLSWKERSRRNEVESVSRLAASACRGYREASWSSRSR